MTFCKRRHGPVLGSLLAAGLLACIGSPPALAAPPAPPATTPVPPGTHCYDLESLAPAIEEIERRKPCLRRRCAAFNSQEACNTEANHKLGCGWCGGRCRSFQAAHQAFIGCVRAAYADHQPDRVNGRTIPGRVSMSTQAYTYRGSAGPVTPSPGVPDDLRNAYRWDVSEVSRPAGERVPIHMHPFGGFIKILEGRDISVFVEGEKDLLGLKAGDHYAMPANRKMGTHCGGPTGYRDLDVFKLNLCYPAWVVLEPAGYPLQDRPFALEAEEACE